MTVDCTAQEETLGWEIAWLEHEHRAISSAVSYFEQRNCIVHVSESVHEIQTWVHGNGYNVLLTDLRIPGGQRSGADLVREIKASGKPIVIVPVSQYLGEYESDLPGEVFSQAVDKGCLEATDGPALLWRHISSLAGEGNLRVVERAFGYVEEDAGDYYVFRVELPDGEIVSRAFLKRHLRRLQTAGEPSRFLEISTIERLHGPCVEVKTLLRWIPQPRWDEPPQ